MISIQGALVYQLQSLSDLLSRLDNEAYCHASKWLSGASIGQHSRHVIELVQCLLKGYDDALVNYDNRKRDNLLETDISFAIDSVSELIAQINQPDKPVLVEGNFDLEVQIPIQIQSTYHREIAYNIEHAVHHMALIKVGLKELNIALHDENFGVAYATVQHRKLCAQ
jgi:hypothetical protein